MLNFTRYPSFRPEEFQCKCCGKVEMNPLFMECLQNLRIYLKSPLTITSGYRCPAHEKAIGGSGANHPLGKAADIVANRSTLSRLVTEAAKYGFNGIGVSLHGPNKFVHLDTSHKLLTVWSY